jgi:hypothetical protein
MQDRMEGTGRLLRRDERVCHFCSVCGFSKPCDTVFWAILIEIYLSTLGLVFIKLRLRLTRKRRK